MIQTYLFTLSGPLVIERRLTSMFVLPWIDWALILVAFCFIEIPSANFSTQTSLSSEHSTLSTSDKPSRERESVWMNHQILLGFRYKSSKLKASLLALTLFFQYDSLWLWTSLLKPQPELGPFILLHNFDLSIINHHHKVIKFHLCLLPLIFHIG